MDGASRSADIPWVRTCSGGSDSSKIASRFNREDRFQSMMPVLYSILVVLAQESWMA